MRILVTTFLVLMCVCNAIADVRPAAIAFDIDNTLLTVEGVDFRSRAEAEAWIRENKSLLDQMGLEARYYHPEGRSPSLIYFPKGLFQYFEALQRHSGLTILFTSTDKVKHSHEKLSVIRSNDGSRDVLELLGERGRIVNRESYQLAELSETIQDTQYKVITPEQLRLIDQLGLREFYDPSLRRLADGSARLQGIIGDMKYFGELARQYDIKAIVDDKLGILHPRDLHLLRLHHWYFEASVDERVKAKGEAFRGKRLRLNKSGAVQFLKRNGLFQPAAQLVNSRRHLNMGLCRKLFSKQ